MRRSIMYLLMIAVLVLGACQSNSSSDSQDGNKEEESKDQIKITTTVFPIASFAKQIGGDHVSVNSIYPPGTDIHTFEPSQKDMIEYSKSDLFFYTSDDLDTMTTNITKSIKKDVEVVAVAKDISKENILAHNHDHGHEGHDHATEEKYNHEGHNHGENDPHVWLDPIHSITMAKAIKDELVKHDESNKEEYEENFKELKEELTKIDEKLHTVTESAKHQEVYISHESIGYLADHYGFEQVGVSGLNNEEPTQKDIINVVKKIKKDGAKHILVEQNVSSKTVDMIKEQTKVEPVEFHNLSTLTKEEETEDNITYQSIMQKNIDALKKAMQ
ncbi:metal ABC transporter solute-binding protein, Zn/Mn family [Abyssicoccus albus]|uniref:metal ABC transporter solute-binding protein, Zn/Mn family n=1 Tax=Abyssicoccus albus TaxID=1817405 RepID=UPI001CEF92E7|nr:zinc ABC transporter substrate-binding protein [Abyssicoccus albus]